MLLTGVIRDAVWPRDVLTLTLESAYGVQLNRFVDTSQL